MKVRGVRRGFNLPSAPLLALTLPQVVVVKRLFLWFAERHGHPWLEWLDRDGIDLGKGKRMLVRSGKLDPKHQITVPGDLDAVG